VAGGSTAAAAGSIRSPPPRVRPGARNRYPPLWKYVAGRLWKNLVALILGLIYTLPNFFGEAPAVQVSSAKATVKVDAAAARRVEER
jgi:hypothetical protein